MEISNYLGFLGHYVVTPWKVDSLVILCLTSHYQQIYFGFLGNFEPSLIK